MDLALNNLNHSNVISEGAIQLIKRIRDDCVYGHKSGKMKMSTISHYKELNPEEFEDES